MKGLPDARKMPGVYNPITTPPHSRRSMSYCVKSGHRQPRPTAHRPTPPDNPDPLCGVLVCFRSPSIHGHTVPTPPPDNPDQRYPPLYILYSFYCIYSFNYTIFDLHWWTVKCSFFKYHTFPNFYTVNLSTIHSII